MQCPLCLRILPIFGQNTGTLVASDKSDGRIAIREFRLLMRIDSTIQKKCAMCGESDEKAGRANKQPRCATLKGVYMKTGLKKRASDTQIIAMGFFLLILAGTVLLCLPWASRSRTWTSVSDALFTAVSASCVTGLVVVDTYTHWSWFGRGIILVLIQIGGLGFMTIATQFFVLMRHRIGLRTRETLSESISTTQIGGILQLTKQIICGTAMIEGAGAVLLAFRFCPQFGVPHGLVYSVFHAVSAFCNAGFDLMGCFEPYGSLTPYAQDPLVVLTITALILIGGVGFIVWNDMVRFRFHFRKYRLHSKIVLCMTGALTVGGMLLFLLFERNATSAGMSTGGRLLTALFDAVTPRTAGFNTVDTAQMSDSGKLLTIFLMFIGGSPGSTAGGVKTTTIAVIWLYTAAYIGRRSSFGAFERRIHPDIVKKSCVVLCTNMMLALTGALWITAADGLPLVDVLFETFSAVGTVGMSTGITRDLSTMSRILIMLLMYCGRVGSLSFAIALTERKAPPDVKNPIEPIVVG